MRLNNRWFQLGASLVAMIMIANLQYPGRYSSIPYRKAPAGSSPTSSSRSRCSSCVRRGFSRSMDG